MDIWYSKDQNPLSNLAKRIFVDLDGKAYISVEHAYQVWKSGFFNEDIYKKNWKAGSYFRGKLKTKIKNNWNIHLMKSIMLVSFEQNKEARNLLLNTSDEIFTHKNGCDIWKTWFPKLLTEIREELNEDN